MWSCPLAIHPVQEVGAEDFLDKVEWVPLQVEASNQDVHHVVRANLVELLSEQPLQGAEETHGILWNRVEVAQGPDHTHSRGNRDRLSTKETRCISFGSQLGVTVALAELDENH